MSFFNDSPLEISSNILSYLPNADLARACRVSRHARAIATRVLYAAPTLLLTQRPGPVAMDIFLRTLLSPDGDKLAVHVRYLTVYWNPIEYGKPSPPACPIDTALFGAAAERLGLPCRTRGDTVIVLLCLLPHLTHLDLHPPSDCDAFNKFLKTPHIAVLQHLRVLDYNPPPRRRDRYPGTTETPELLALLRLPQLRSINAHLDCGTTAIDTSAADTPVGTSAITYLALRHASITPSAVSNILRLMTSLKHLRFAPQTTDTDFDISSLRLDAVKHVLTHLHIDLSWVMQYAVPPDTACRLLGSLREYPALRTLRCSLQCLLGREVPAAGQRLAGLLPPQLAELEIFRDCYWEGKDKVGKLFELLADKDAMVPGLKQIAVGVGSLRKALAEACGDVGVRLVVMRLPAATGIVRTKVQRCWRG